MRRLNTKKGLVITLLILLLALSQTAYAKKISSNENANKKIITEDTENKKVSEKRKQIFN